MKFVAAPILILLIMTQVFSNWFVVLSFKLNRDYIAKNLCENRYRPKLNCKGNCVLMKKLREEEKKEQNAPANLKLEITSIILSSKSFFAITETPVFVLTTSSRSAENSGKPIDRTVDIFHPPAV
jgi:hypothetical protein